MRFKRCNMFFLVIVAVTTIAICDLNSTTTIINTAGIQPGYTQYTVAQGDTLYIDMPNDRTLYAFEYSDGCDYRLIVAGTIIVNRGGLAIYKRAEVLDGGKIIVQNKGQLMFGIYMDIPFYIRNGGLVSIRDSAEFFINRVASVLNPYTDVMTQAAANLYFADKSVRFKRIGVRDDPGYMEGYLLQGDYSNLMIVEPGGVFEMRDRSYGEWTGQFHVAGGELNFYDDAQFWLGRYGNVWADIVPFHGGTVNLRNRSLVGWRHGSWTDLRNNGIINLYDSSTMFMGTSSLFWNGMAVKYGFDDNPGNCGPCAEMVLWNRNYENTTNLGSGVGHQITPAEKRTGAELLADPVWANSLKNVVENYPDFEDSSFYTGLIQLHNKSRLIRAKNGNSRIGWDHAWGGSQYGNAPPTWWLSPMSVSTPWWQDPDNFAWGGPNPSSSTNNTNINREYGFSFFNGGASNDAAGDVEKRFGDNIIGVLNIYDSAYFEFTSLQNGNGKSTDFQNGPADNSGNYNDGDGYDLDKGNIGVINVYNSGRAVVHLNFFNATAKGTLGAINVHGENAIVQADRGFVNGAHRYGTGILTIDSGGIFKVRSNFKNTFDNNVNCTGIINILNGSTLEIDDVLNLVHNNYVNPVGQINLISDGRMIVKKNLIISNNNRNTGGYNNFGTGLFVYGGKLIFSVDSTDASTIANTASSYLLSSRNIRIMDTTINNPSAVNNGHHYFGSFIVDNNKTLYVAGSTNNFNNNPANNYMIILDANTQPTSMYEDYATNQSNLTKYDVDAALAVLSGATLWFGNNDTILGIADTNLKRNNLILNQRFDADNIYFHRGTYGSDVDKPGKVKYNWTQPILKTASTHPYGILEVGDYYGGGQAINIYTPTWLQDTIYIAGETDLAFDWQKTNANYQNYGTTTFERNIVISGSRTNLLRTDNKEIVGTVLRKPNWDDVPVILNEVDYAFNNRHTLFSFKDATNVDGTVSYMTSFGLNILPGVSPDVLYGTNVDLYAQRKVKQFFTLSDNLPSSVVPKIKKFSIGYK